LGANPNQIAVNSKPIYQVSTEFTQLVYGPAEPPLQEGMQYAWRVQAKDKDGRDAFRNNGYSEVCSFTCRRQAGGSIFMHGYKVAQPNTLLLPVRLGVQTLVQDKRRE
jgi:hypothetical protein